MQLTENEMRGLIRGQCLPSDMFVGESLAAYLVRKFDERQQKVDALAAENASLRHLLDMAGETGNANFGRTMLPTPATDAYLNSVRAEGADNVATFHSIRMEVLKEVHRQGYLFHKAAYGDAVLVAAKLRAGQEAK